MAQGEGHGGRSGRNRKGGTVIIAAKSLIPSEKHRPATASLMRAATVIRPGTVEVGQTVKPTPGPGQLLIRLEGCGVCASNVPPWEGRQWFQYPLAPGQLGHEGWGRVEVAGVR